MNQQEYLEFHKNFCNQMIELTAKKNSDYSTEDDPFSSFRKAELLNICSNEAGFLIRIMDKISRITNYLNKGQLLVEDESVTDSLQDCANYCILLAGYIESKKSNEQYLNEVDNTELNEIDKDILKLLNVDSGYWEDHIFDAFRGMYSARAIVESLHKLLQLNKITVDDKDVYRLI